MPFINVPWWILVVYWVGFAVCWRTLTGHMAWSVHRTASKRETIQPPVENWIVSAIPCAALSLIWFAVLLFVIPWPWKRGDEAAAAVMLKKIDLRQMEAGNLEHEHRAELEWDKQFKTLRGEVEPHDYD